MILSFCSIISFVCFLIFLVLCCFNIFVVSFVFVRLILLDCRSFLSIYNDSRFWEEKIEFFLLFEKILRVVFEINFLWINLLVVMLIFFIFGDSIFFILFSDKFFFIFWIIEMCFKIFFFGKNVFCFVNVDLWINYFLGIKFFCFYWYSWLYEIDVFLSNFFLEINCFFISLVFLMDLL